MKTEKTEKIETQISQVFNRLRRLQKTVADLQSQAQSIYHKNEIRTRERLNGYFDDGLSLLGKGLARGKKVKELFVAETHRKAKKYEKKEQQPLATDDFTSFKVASTRSAPVPKSKANTKTMMKAQSKKSRSQHRAPARTH